MTTSVLTGPNRRVTGTADNNLQSPCAQFQSEHRTLNLGQTNLPPGTSMVRMGGRFLAPGTLFDVRASAQRSEVVLTLLGFDTR
jgi:hypothetical protein